MPTPAHSEKPWMLPVRSGIVVKDFRFGQNRSEQSPPFSVPVPQPE